LRISRVSDGIKNLISLFLKSDLRHLRVKERLFLFHTMKKFIKSFRLLKTFHPDLECKLVWNPDPLTPSNNPWLVTFKFSKRLIEARGMEVVYGY